MASQCFVVRLVVQHIRDKSSWWSFEKIGKPVFREDDDGKRRMHLLIDVGESFRPKDIYVQAIKSNRFQVCSPNTPLILHNTFIHHGGSTAKSQQMTRVYREKNKMTFKNEKR